MAQCARFSFMKKNGPQSLPANLSTILSLD